MAARIRRLENAHPFPLAAMRTVILVLIGLPCTGTTAAVFMRDAHQRETMARARDLTGGDPDRGKLVARTLGCVACHVMPGIRGPESKVAPPLSGFFGRKFVAGATSNQPENLIRFIRNPRAVAPASAMPDVGATETQARDLAAYLYTLE